MDESSCAPLDGSLEGSGMFGIVRALEKAGARKRELFPVHSHRQGHSLLEGGFLSLFPILQAIGGI